jgi:hypothetical protein
MSIEKAIEKIKNVPLVNKTLLEKYPDKFFYGARYALELALEILEEEKTCSKCEVLECKIMNLEVEYSELLERRTENDN